MPNRSGPAEQGRLETRGGRGEIMPHDKSQYSTYDNDYESYWRKPIVVEVVYAETLSHSKCLYTPQGKFICDQ